MTSEARRARLTAGARWSALAILAAAALLFPVVFSNPVVTNYGVFALIFVTADFVWGPDEAHYESHRYMVSACVYKHAALTDYESYFLEDRYMTAKKYNSEAGQDEVVASIVRALKKYRDEVETVVEQ